MSVHSISDSIAIFFMNRIKNLQDVFSITRDSARHIDRVLKEIRAKKDEEFLWEQLESIKGEINGYSVEVLEHKNERKDLVAWYINKGDTYVNTIIITKRYFPIVDCVGNYVERHPEIF